MSFLAPLFLLGAAAIALPIVFHLIRRSSRERIPFSSLMFLLPTPPRVTRRSRIENWFLLLLRCGVIALLAFAFARPFLSRAVAPDPASLAGQRVVLLVDTSASMRRAGLWSKARETTRSLLDKISPADQVACLTFDRDVRSLVSFDQWSQLPAGERNLTLLRRLDEVNPGWGSTRLGYALITACELFDSVGKDEPGAKRIVLITDLQEGSRLDGLQGFEWPRGIQVAVESLRADRTSNAGLQLASEQDTGRYAGGPEARVRISNSADSKKERFQIGWRGSNAGFSGPTIDVYVPPGQNRIIPVPPPPTNSLPVPETLMLAGDDEAFDNTAYVVQSKPQRAKVLFLGNDREQDPAGLLYYLRRAFQETPRLATELVVRNPGAAVTPQDLADATLMIVNDALPEAQVANVKSFLTMGKAVLFPLSKLAMAPTLGRLLDQDRFGAEEASMANYAMLARIDFEHPLFAPFADPRYSDFTKIHFWKHRRLALDDVPHTRVLARFDSGDPALAEIWVGQGRLWVLTAGWQPEDSQLALSSKFVPLLYAMLEQSGGLREGRSHYAIGDTVTLPIESGSVTVRKPDGSEVTVARGETFAGTDQPGIYGVTSVQPPVTFAVNLAPEESRTAPLGLEELERLGMPLEQELTGSPRQIQQRKEHLQAAQLESRQKLWRWLIVAALVVLMMETWLAGRLTRRAVPVAGD